MASARGAQSAVRALSCLYMALTKATFLQLLYSLYSETCTINPEYVANVDHVFDIFATQLLPVSR